MLEVPIHRAEILQLGAPVTRVSIGNPEVADLVIIRANQVYVLGRQLGTTNVLLWDRDDSLVGTVNVEVTHDLESLKAKLHTLLPDERVEVHSAQRSIVLRGQVSSIAVMDVALEVARAYLVETRGTASSATGSDGGADSGSRSGGDPGAGYGSRSGSQVINQLQVAGAQQVILEVKVAEISRNVLKRLDAQFNAIHTGYDDWTLGGVNGGLTQEGAGLPFRPDPQIIQSAGLFTSFLNDSFLFDLAIDAAKDNGMARILAEPTLTTLTGEEARFLSGGEFPIPVPQGDQSVTVEFREFGVGLGFLPVVLGDGIINARLSISVSELISTAGLGVQPAGSTASFVVPSLSKRSADVTVELREGQTLAIAGLINENMRELVSRFPGLGDLPILGNLFRSQDFRRNETELVILVTPHLAKPISPDQIRLPTDGYEEPSDVGFFLFGHRAEQRRGERRPIPNGSGGTEANFGHRLQ
jgi:pilus assembly protein CpaC